MAAVLIFEFQNFTSTWLGKVMKFQFNYFSRLGATFRNLRGGRHPPLPSSQSLGLKCEQKQILRNFLKCS